VKRAPTTFSLVLGLTALAVLLALTLAAVLSTRSRLRTVSRTYGQLVATTALAADQLATRDDPGSMRALKALRSLGVRFSDTPPPPPLPRLAPMAESVSREAGALLGDTTRVAITPSLRSSQIWVRSRHDPRRWIVLQSVGYRLRIVHSTLTLTVLAGLVTLVAAGLGARRLTRPLERLSAQASALLAGDPAIRRQLYGSPYEVQQLAEAIDQAGQRLRHAARERELMLAGVSHDLRTPLARLRLALELGDAGDPQLRGAMVTDLQELDSALEQCQAFVRDGGDEAMRDMDLATLAGQLLALRRQPDDWRLEGAAHLNVPAYPTLLRRAIGNLMDNAERYGRPPFLLDLGSDGRHCFVRVADHGPGVPPGLLERLGQPFLRGDPARGGGGSGLGLSIVKRAAERHGGTLDLRNGEHAGLVATLSFPHRRTA